MAIPLFIDLGYILRTNNPLVYLNATQNTLAIMILQLVFLMFNNFTNLKNPVGKIDQ